MKIQAFFWDYDNTILETAEAHWNKHVTILASHGIVLEQKFRPRVYENNGNQNWEWMRDELGLKLNEKDYLKAIDVEFQKHMLGLQMRSGVEQLIGVLEAHQIPQAIVTNARRDSAEPVLHQKGILQKMSLALYKEDYQGRKPDPAPYLEGFKRMEQRIGAPLMPSRCIAIEDDPKGVESASQAGAIVVHRKLDQNMEDCPFADYVCFHEQEFVALILGIIKK